MPHDGVKHMTAADHPVVDSASLTSRAMLASLHITRPGTSKKEKLVAQEVADKHGNDQAMVRVTKALFTKEALAQVSTIAGAAREYHYEQTLPWLDSGARILPSDNFFVYSEKMRDMRAEFDACVDEFIEKYPTFVSQARDKLGDLFDPNEYPRADRLRAAFSFETNFASIPESTDWRLPLGDDIIAQLSNDVEARYKVATEQAMQDLWQRIHESVSHMAEKLKNYKPPVRKSKENPEAEKAESIFRDSMVDNMRGLVDVLTRLNLTGSAELAAMTDRLYKELCQEDADTLRKNDTVRADVAAAAEKILEEVSAFLA